jgi:hypothetical protein
MALSIIELVQGNEVGAIKLTPLGYRHLVELSARRHNIQNREEG